MISVSKIESRALTALMVSDFVLPAFGGLMMPLSREQGDILDTHHGMRSIDRRARHGRAADNVVSFRDMKPRGRMMAAADRRGRDAPPL